tara:strand:+ start:36730 stop:37293 length:564 start_codon:yes stop_codon:yes gene_type:complete
MNNKHISAIILATTLSFGGTSYAMAESQQGMKNGQNCATEMQNNENKCDVKSDDMQKAKHHNKKHQGKNHDQKRQGKHQGKHQQNMEFAKLDLTDTQKQAMRDIMKAMKDSNKSSKASHHTEMKALMSNETFNAEKATELISQQQVQKAEKRLAMMKAKHDMYQLLTDDQKAKYDELKGKRQNRSAN